jgi:hypothetical protein
MYEAAIQQVYTLCQHDGVTTGLSPETRAANAMVRARIFWYAHVHEGLTTGLRGGRLLLYVQSNPFGSSYSHSFSRCYCRCYFVGTMMTLKRSNKNCPQHLLSTPEHYKRPT